MGADLGALRSRGRFEAKLSRGRYRRNDGRQVGEVERSRGEAHIEPVHLPRLVEVEGEHRVARKPAQLGLDVERVEPELLSGQRAAGRHGEPATGGRWLRGEAQPIDAQESGVRDREVVGRQIEDAEPRDRVGRERRGQRGVLHPEPPHGEPAAAGRVGGLLEHL